MHCSRTRREFTAELINKMHVNNTIQWYHNDFENMKRKPGRYPFCTRKRVPARAAVPVVVTTQRRHTSSPWGLSPRKCLSGPWGVLQGSLSLYVRNYNAKSSTVLPKYQNDLCYVF